MYNSLTKCLSLGLLVLVAACGDAPEYRVGLDLNEIQFEFFDETEGVFPSRAVLRNPNNPFAEYSIGSTVTRPGLPPTKFAILDGASNAGAFYAWATALVGEPTGENQFFTALKLRDLLEADEVPVEERELVRQQAIDGFQSVLDSFPDSVLFDVTGTQSFRLATPAYQEIVGLNGTPQGDWVLVQDENGNPVAVRSTDGGFDR